MPILYSDFTVSRDVLPGKKAIGVVFDENRRLAVGLVNLQGKWQSSQIWGKHVDGVDIPNLPNLSNKSSAEADFNGKSNTDIIYNHVYNIPHSDIGWGIFFRAHDYNIAGTDGGKWYIPALGELILLQKKRDAVNVSLAKISRAQLLSTDQDSIYNVHYWSSTEYSKDEAWYVHMPSGEVTHIWKYASSTLYRPIIKY